MNIKDDNSNDPSPFFHSSTLILFESLYQTPGARPRRQAPLVVCLSGDVASWAMLEIYRVSASIIAVKNVSV